MTEKKKSAAATRIGALIGAVLGVILLAIQPRQERPKSPIKNVLSRGVAGITGGGIMGALFGGFVGAMRRETAEAKAKAAEKDKKETP